MTRHCLRLALLVTLGAVLVACGGGASKDQDVARLQSEVAGLRQQVEATTTTASAATTTTAAATTTTTAPATTTTVKRVVTTTTRPVPATTTTARAAVSCSVSAPSDPPANTMIPVVVRTNLPGAWLTILISGSSGSGSRTGADGTLTRSMGVGRAGEHVISVTTSADPPDGPSTALPCSMTIWAS